MDLLGSIMSKMEKPPSTLTPSQREARKQEMERTRKLKEREKEKIRKFKKEMETLVGQFSDNDTVSKQELPAMDELQRSIVHEVAELAGVVCHSFGVENIDRHIVLFKKDYEIHPDELAALRRGEEFDPVRHKQELFERDLQQRLDEQKVVQRQLQEHSPGGARRRGGSSSTAKHSQQDQPAPAFVQKRRHLLGDVQATSALRPAEVNSQFGVVASHLKIDKRSIEETLADIRAKKQRIGSDEQS